MVHFGNRWRSIERTLPLLIVCLQVGTVAVFTLAASKRVEQILLAAAGQRLQSASMPVAMMLEQATAQLKPQLAQVAGDSVIVRYLTTGRGAHAARQALAHAWAGEDHPRVRIELRHADGTVALDTALGDVPAGSGWLDRTIRARAVTPDAPVVGPLVTSGDATFTEALAVVYPASRPRSRQPHDAVQSGSSRPVGYITDLDFLSTKGAPTVRALIGDQATVLLGSWKEGDWTDLEHPAPRPPLSTQPDHPVVFDASTRGPGVGAATAIRGTPWVVWVEQPRSTVLAPMHALVWHLATLAVALLVVGGGAAWGLSRRITRPIVALTEATERVASTRSTDTRHDAPDEISRLTDAFGRMSTRVEDAQQQLQQKNVELEEASRMKSEFLATMSHELRTPLNAIIGFAEVLRDGLLGDLTNQQRGFLDDISGSGNHLLSLINDILDLSKVEAGKMTLDLAPVELSALFVGSLSILKEKAAKTHVRLDEQSTEELGLVLVDARKVKQIVYNLLSNAVKFTPEHGHVTLHANQVPRAKVGQLSGDRPGRVFPLAESDYAEFIEISVVDTGIGISPDGLAQLFRPFSQIDSRLARQFEGTGLGLAMVKALAELHGGTVAVESTAGEGCRFTVWLPIRAVFADVLTPGIRLTDPEYSRVPGTRVALVVEGDFKSAELIRLQLEAEGFEVLHAASAEAALVLAVQQPLALITLDIRLPNMDGWEFLRRVKRVPDLQHIPVVIISIVADSQKGFLLGAAAVMEKPISRQQLYDSLTALGFVPISQGQTLKVLVADDDPQAVELVAIRIADFANTVLRAFGGREAIEIARREVPDVIVLDLMMPDVSGFDVVHALQEQVATARIPILMVTAKKITDDDRIRLNGYVTTIMEKSEFSRSRFASEVRRATAGRRVAA